MSEEEKKNQELENNVESEEEKFETEEEINSEEIVEETYENDDDLNIYISTDDVKSLTEEEIDIVAVKVEVAIEKYENILMKGTDEALSFEEIIELGYDDEEYKRLKKLDKEIYKQRHALHKNVKETGFFGAMPSWAFALFIICALFTIMPVNPYLPISIFGSLYPKFTSEFMLGYGGAYLFYFLYIGLFFGTELIMFVILLIKAIKNKERRGAFKSYLVLFIINIIIDIPGLIIFLNALR